MQFPNWRGKNLLLHCGVFLVVIFSKNLADDKNKAVNGGEGLMETVLLL